MEASAAQTLLEVQSQVQVQSGLDGFASRFLFTRRDQGLVRVPLSFRQRMLGTPSGRSSIPCCSLQVSHSKECLLRHS
jgi:hypothetical protein